MRYSGIREAYYSLLDHMKAHGEERMSRNGRVLCLPEPVLVRFDDPLDRVLACPARRANPFFHVMEAVWMLAGRNDVAYVRQFNQQMYTYSDDGVRFNGAYGFRWREHFGVDQLLQAAEMLRENPNDRRVVIGMWDASEDLGSESLDIPCNTQIMFRADTGLLDMTTTNRSNDLIWGLCGANWVHMTILHEWMSVAVGVPIGTWHHMTNNLHVYEHHWPLLDTPPTHLPALPTLPLTQHPRRFLEQCEWFVEGRYDRVDEPWLRTVALPLFLSWKAHKQGDSIRAFAYASTIQAEDWKHAALTWLRGAKK